MIILHSDAELSPCGRYRYTLTREWGLDKPRLGLIMLNPSTADHTKNDPTVMASITLAGRWGFGALAICNLFAWRSPSTAALRKAVLDGVAVGPENDGWLRSMAQSVDQVAVGWGSWGKTYIDRVQQVNHLIRHLGKLPRCIGITETGHPKHFLLRFHTAQQKAAAQLEPWTYPCH